MPVDPAYVGRVYPSTEPYQVSREKIREFAAAIGDPNPVYRDPAAARSLGYPDVIAPPTFAIVVTSRAGEQVIDDPDFGLDYSRVVHREQRFVHARPVRAGDVLTVVLAVQDVRAVAGNDVVTTRAEVAAADGEHVLTAYSTLVARATP
jgi:acyl dehydratase